VSGVRWLGITGQHHYPGPGVNRLTVLMERLVLLVGTSPYSSPVSRYDGSVVVVVDWRVEVLEDCAEAGLSISVTGHLWCGNIIIERQPHNTDISRPRYVMIDLCLVVC